jgi:hypothetical protein
VTTRHLATGNTPRQELIEHAASKLRAGRARDAHTALEAAVDGARPGTIGGAMLAYYKATSDLALERLIAAVERKAGNHNHRRITQ